MVRRNIHGIAASPLGVLVDDEALLQEQRKFLIRRAKLEMNLSLKPEATLDEIAEVKHRKYFHHHLKASHPHRILSQLVDIQE